MTLTYLSEILRIDNLINISVSDVESDPETGAYVRRIEFYTDELSEINRRPVLTVMVYGDADALKIQTPTLSF